MTDAHPPGPHAARYDRWANDGILDAAISTVSDDDLRIGGGARLQAHRWKY